MCSADGSLLREALVPINARGLAYLYEAPVRQFTRFGGDMYTKTKLPASTFGDLIAHCMNVARADLHTR